MSAVAERLNFSILQGAAFPLRGVSTCAGAIPIAVFGRTAVVGGKDPAAALLIDGVGLSRSKLGIDTAPDCRALARFCNSGPVITNLSSANGFLRRAAACAFAAAVVLNAVAGVDCGTRGLAIGNEGFATTLDTAGAVVDICCRVVVSAANT